MSMDINDFAFHQLEKAELNHKGAPISGGGTDGTAFLQGSLTAGPNASPAAMSAIFWIETVKPKGGGPEFLQLQYTQTVLLNFNGLSWPHVSVATLRKA